MALTTLQDAEQLVIDHLYGLGFHAVTDLPADPGFTDGLPWVMVTRSGGPATLRGYLDQPLLDIDVYGASRSQANDTVAEVRAAVLTMPAQSGRVSKVREEAGPTKRPDPNPAVVRIGFTAEVFIRQR